ncbi:MAG: helicase-associated domain-containing protein [Planctomycetes bacterium]|nr:helicase-associated domain-containing protein [Planctomycetota bacterium]
MVRRAEPESLTVGEAFSQLTVGELKPLIAMLQGRKKSHIQGRKDELVEILARTMTSPKEVLALYEGLDDISQKAIQEAAHDPKGILDRDRFQAKYGQSPQFGGAGRFRDEPQPNALDLFFPRHLVLPSDLRTLLLTFVPEPPALTVQASAELPARVRGPYQDLGSDYYKPDEEEVELRVRETARAALLDIKALLRLVDAGEVRVSDKTHRPTRITVQTVARILIGGDFYTAEDISEWEDDPGYDLTLKAFAWPLILQAAGLAQLAGKKLQLTPTGRKATTKPAQEVIRLAWDKWLRTTLLDEFNRISVIKGQGGALTAVAPRREAVVEVLKECPAGQWISTEELFRLLKILPREFEVSRDAWRLYLFEQEYGSLGYDAHYAWETLQGRFVLAFLFEYAATLGLVDVAYISPVGARNDFYDRWGTDDLTFLSRYDGLLDVRINSLGAWCLGLTEEYQPEPVQAKPVLKVLPNLDVVAGEQPLDPGDVLLQERFAERQSEAVWRLRTGKVLEAVEAGLTVAELQDFLTTRSQGPLPQTVAVFLDDLQTRTGQLEDLGQARLIACADANVARLLAHDRNLRRLCELAGERQLVFRAADESAVRRALRELGYVVPPPR